TVPRSRIRELPVFRSAHESILPAGIRPHRRSSPLPRERPIALAGRCRRRQSIPSRSDGRNRRRGRSSRSSGRAGPGWAHSPKNTTWFPSGSGVGDPVEEPCIPVGGSPLPADADGGRESVEHDRSLVIIVAVEWLYYAITFSSDPHRSRTDKM